MGDQKDAKAKEEVNELSSGDEKNKKDKEDKKNVKETEHKPAEAGSSNTAAVLAAGAGEAEADA